MSLYSLDKGWLRRPAALLRGIPFTVIKDCGNNRNMGSQLHQMLYACKLNCQGEPMFMFAYYCLFVVDHVHNPLLRYAPRSSKVCSEMIHIECNFSEWCARVEVAPCGSDLALPTYIISPVRPGSEAWATAPIHRSQSTFMAFCALCTSNTPEDSQSLCSAFAIATS